MTTQPQPAGKQIYNNYGAKSNEELLLAYGFVLDPNPDDIVVLRLGTSMDVDKRTRGKRLDVGKMFYLRRDGEVDKELLEVMRATLRQDEPDVDEEDEHALHERETRELQLELDVVGTLGQMMEDMQVKLQAGVDREIGEPGQIREEVRRMCEVYRRGEGSK